MKNLLLLCILFTGCLFHARASHSAGAELYYHYVGDTANPYQYEVTLILYRYTGGASFGNSQTIELNSSCYGNASYSLPAYVPPGANINSVGGIVIPNLNECSDSSFNSGSIEAFFFRDTLVLSGTCSDYTFSWDMCCRNNTDNLVNASSNRLYVESLLNNTYGPNSSPKMLSLGAKNFCTGLEMRWYHHAAEPNGDSLFYTLAQPLDDANRAIAWVPGYSTSQPISTATGVFMNPTNGEMRFTPIQAESGAIKIQVNEFRKIQSQWVQVGSTERDIYYAVTGSCPSYVSDIELRQKGSAPGMSELSCGTKFIRLTSSTRVECSTISPDGIDFALINSQGTLVPIIAAGADTCGSGFSNSLWLQLKDSISYNDTLTLVTRIGNDLGTITNVCGYSIGEDDSLQFFVQSCPTSGVEETSHQNFSLYPNPATNELVIRFTNGSGKRKLQILNLQGQVLRDLNANEPVKHIDLSNLASGIYLIRSSEDQQHLTKAFKKL